MKLFFWKINAWVGSCSKKLHEITCGANQTCFTALWLQCICTSIFHFGDYFDRSVEVPKLKKTIFNVRRGTSALLSRVFCLMQSPTSEISAQIFKESLYQNQTSPLNSVRGIIDLQQPLKWAFEPRWVRCSLACRVPSHGNAAVTFSTIKYAADMKAYTGKGVGGWG